MSCLDCNGSFVFIIFTVICGLATTLTFFFLPETKGKTLEEIEQYFESGTKKTIPVR